MPTIDLTDDEVAAVTAAIRRAIEDDKFPHAPRLDPLRAALARFDAATERTDLKAKPNIQADRPESGKAIDQAAPLPKAPPPAKADKRARSL
jgi:hypothetical protein